MTDYNPAHPKPVKRVKKKSNPKVTEPERMIQGRAEDYLAALGVRPIRLPDALLRIFFTNRSIPSYQAKIVSGYLKGLPDLIIPRRVGNRTLMLPLEIKTEAGKPSNSQLAWGESLGTVFTYGWDETKKAIDDFLNEDLTKLLEDK